MEEEQPSRSGLFINVNNLQNRFVLGNVHQ